MACRGLPQLKRMPRTTGLARPSCFSRSRCTTLISKNSQSIRAENVHRRPRRPRFSTALLRSVRRKQARSAGISPHFRPTDPPNRRARGRAHGFVDGCVRGDQFRPNLNDVEACQTREASKSDRAESRTTQRGESPRRKDLSTDWEAGFVIRGIAIFSDET